MRDAGTAGQVGGTERRERRKDAPGHDVGARIVAMARAAAALHLVMSTQGGVDRSDAHGGFAGERAGALGAGGAR